MLSITWTLLSASNSPATTVKSSSRLSERERERNYEEKGMIVRKDKGMVIFSKTRDCEGVVCFGITVGGHKRKEGGRKKADMGYLMSA